MFSNTQNQRRTHESPMDWEWQTRGPSDPHTPFPQYKPQQGQKASFESPKPPSSFVAASSTPAPQFRNPSFTTPRKPFDTDLFSEASGAESSPADNADVEDTPELPSSTTTMTAFTGNSHKKPLFGQYGVGFSQNSPGRPEQRRAKHVHALVHKVRKRKRMDVEYSMMRSKRGESDSESDARESRSTRKGKKEETEQGWISSFFSGIESRPNLPHVLSFYTQLGFNFFMLALTVFGIWTFWTAIRADVDKASEDARAEVMGKIAKCARDYVDNRCAMDVRLPALEPVCNEWELCMNRDPHSIGRAKVSAHTFAQIFNSFIEPISYKAMIFVVLIVTVCIVANNVAFGMFRSSKHSSIPPVQPFFPSQQQQNFQWGAPPQTPQHHIGYDAWGGQTFQAIMPSQTPGRSPSKGSRSPSKGNRSPSKGELY